MTDITNLVRYRHETEEWTVGRLRTVLEGLPDDMPLRIDVPPAPRSNELNEPEDDREYVLGAVVLDGSDHLVQEELVLRADFSAGWYMRPE
ncbi:DUF6225 family protein [Actinocorallia sp. B10E7]|uniref:DUF6225 family protein n=1 Tax=Actinocorallia sp. B10E7 TaxID=3153558 RepID=UPI00325E3C31